MTATLEAPAESQAVATVQRPEIAALVAQKAAIQSMADKYLPLTIAGVDDKAGFKAVHEARMVVKNTRVAVEKRRKELKADALEYGRQVDSAAKQLTALLEPIELHLERQEQAVEAEKARIRQEAEVAKQARVAKRVQLLTELGASLDFAMINGATDEQFEVELEKAKAAHAERVLAEQAAAAERARLEAEAAERRRAEEAAIALERARLEALRLEQEAAAAAERERQEAVRREQEAKLAAERAAMEAKLAAERAELERQRKAQAAEQARIDAERRRVAEEEAARQRAIELERAKAEAAEQARLEAERRAAERAEREKAEAEAREAARLKAEAERPHREQMFSVASAVDNLAGKVPAGPCQQEVIRILSQASSDIRQFAGRPL